MRLLCLTEAYSVSATIIEQYLIMGGEVWLTRHLIQACKKLMVDWSSFLVDRLCILMASCSGPLGSVVGLRSKIVRSQALLLPGSLKRLMWLSLAERFRLALSIYRKLP